MCCDDYPSAVGIVVSQSLQNGGYHGSNGLDNMENLHEMGKDCYRGDPFISICMSMVLFVHLIVELF